MTDSKNGWTEADGTVYRLNKDGDYDVIPPVKKQSKEKKSVKKSASTKKTN